MITIAIATAMLCLVVGITDGDPLTAGVASRMPINRSRSCAWPTWTRPKGSSLRRAQPAGAGRHVHARAGYDHADGARQLTAHCGARVMPR